MFIEGYVSVFVRRSVYRGQVRSLHYYDMSIHCNILLLIVQHEIPAMAWAAWAQQSRAAPVCQRDGGL